jgi:hypothetical protein
LVELADAGWCDWSVLCTEDRQWGVVRCMDMPPNGGYALVITRIDPAWGAQQVEHDTSKLLWRYVYSYHHLLLIVVAIYFLMNTNRVVNYSLTDTSMISTIVGQHDYPVHDVRICPVRSRDILQSKRVVHDGESLVASASEDESVRLWSFTLQPVSIITSHMIPPSSSYADENLHSYYVPINVMDMFVICCLQSGEEDDPGDPVAKYVVERPRIDVRTGVATLPKAQPAKYERLFHTPTTSASGTIITHPSSHFFFS